APPVALVEEVADLGVMADEAKAVAVEGEDARLVPPVANHHVPGVRSSAGPHVERAGRAGRGEELFAVVPDVVEGRLDRVGRGVEFAERSHQSLLCLRGAVRLAG